MAAEKQKHTHVKHDQPACENLTKVVKKSFVKLVKAVADHEAAEVHPDYDAFHRMQDRVALIVSMMSWLKVGIDELPELIRDLQKLDALSKLRGLDKLVELLGKSVADKDETKPDEKTA